MCPVSVMPAIRLCLETMHVTGRSVERGWCRVLSRLVRLPSLLFAAIGLHVLLCRLRDAHPRLHCCSCI